MSGTEQDHTDYPSISLCIIAKDEEDFIAQAIESVLPVIAEIILVDTGSTDRTVEICEGYGAKVYHRPWDDDFSAPRNLSIEQAGGDWILILDADEVIASADHEELRRLTLENDVCWEFLQRHYTEDPRLSNFTPCRGEYPEWEKGHSGYFTSNLSRLFPHHQGLHYQGRVHELVEHSVRTIGKHSIKRTRIPIHHYGHTVAVKRKKNKSTLYTPLGAAKTVEDPNSWKNHYEIAVEHNCNGRSAESVAAFQRSVELNPYYEPSWTNLGYVLCELGRFNEAVQALVNALKLVPSSPEAHCNLGVVFMRIQRWPQAAHHLQLAINARPDYVNAYTNLGQVLINMNKLREAAAVLSKVLELHPRNAGAKADLGMIYLAAKQPARACELLEQSTQECPDLSRAYFYLGQAYQNLQRTNDAVKVLQHFCDLELAKYANNPPPEISQLLNSVRQNCKRMAGTELG